MDGAETGSGYIYFSDARGQEEVASDYERFTDAIPSQPPLARRQVVLITFDGYALEAAALMVRGGKAVTRKWRVTFEYLHWLEDPLPLEDLATALHRGQPGAGRAFDRAASGGGQINDPEWSTILAEVQRLRPRDRDALGRLTERALERRPRPPSGDREPIVLYEHDAVGLALEFAGLDRRPILDSWEGTETAPFLEGLQAYAVPEDRAIDHDAAVFGGWDAIGRNPAGIAVFEEAGRRVTVINANRSGIEGALGVDLVYYHHVYKAYVLVQYKRMRPRSSGTGAEYRPDSQLKRELKRLRKLRSDDSESTDPLEYRLRSEAGYLKICAPATAPAFSHELVHGMYLPLTYWDMLEASGSLAGERGGVVVTFDNVGRYLNNSAFIDLVQAGWVGSAGLTSELVSREIRSALAADRSLILAVAKGRQVQARYSQ